MKEIEDIFDKKVIDTVINFSPGKYKRTNKRALVKKKGGVPENALSGMVLATVGKNYLVQSDVDDELYDCVSAGTIISDNGKSSLIAVGDRVKFLSEENRDERELKTGSILKVEDRHSWLTRKEILNPNEQVLAANIDRLVVIMAAADPFYNKRLIDRYIVAAEYGNLEAVICVNKMDLMDPGFIKEDFKIYEEMGIRVFYVSAINNTDTEELFDMLREKNDGGFVSSALSGPSGVGKSTIINKLFGSDMQAVSEVSDKTTKGRHTTSYAKMFRIPGAGYIVDTPGIREYALYNIEREELALYFHDFDEYRDECKFMPCTHTHEPGCAIKTAVEEGIIDMGRYESYLNIYKSLED